jgi:hypothetical protein
MEDKDQIEALAQAIARYWAFAHPGTFVEIDQSIRAEAAVILGELRIADVVLAKSDRRPPPQSIPAGRDPMTAGWPSDSH